MKKIWIFAEQNGGAVHSSYFELLGKAKELYPNEVITAILLGGGEEALSVLKGSGADMVIHAAHDKLNAYHPDYWAETLYRLAKEHTPETIFIAATAIGSELAPTVAAKLNTGLAAHCTDLNVDGNGELVTVIPAFGGKLLGEILIPQMRPAMATVKPGVFSKRELSCTEHIEVVSADASFLDGCASGIELIGIEEEQAAQGRIEEAEIVVCAGLGISNKENWAKLNELAVLLNASVGYTRPVVDMGYIDHENSMIGTSGKMVRPRLYIGFGISGATHHVCGMKDSSTIVSVNTNDKAPIFGVSDYKLVGDSGKVLDELLNALKG